MLASEAEVVGSNPTERIYVRNQKSFLRTTRFSNKQIKKTAARSFRSRPR